ncbi:MAG: hypothetical protein H7Z72_05190 [Bacteroidetes bacterium]|nr:hypothetical protein [Fibrella sp.]
MKTFEVYPTMTLAHLQRCFTDVFPRLRMEHIRTRRRPKTAVDKETIAALGGGPSHWCFVVEGSMNVADLYTSLRECFGLMVRVDRWTGHAWHTTDATRQWTLEQQNQPGAALSDFTTASIASMRQA